MVVLATNAFPIHAHLSECTYFTVFVGAQEAPHSLRTTAGWHCQVAARRALTSVSGRIDWT